MIHTDTVSMKKPEFRRSLEFTTLCISDEILREEALCGLLPLRCHWLENGSWVEKTFHTDSQMIKIGRHPNRADIALEGPYIEDSQVCLQILGGNWVAIEAGLYNLLSVNGIRTRQLQSSRWSPFLLQIGGTPLLMTFSPQWVFNQSGERIACTPPATEKEFTKISGCGKSLSFEESRTILLGASDECDFKVGDEPFSAIIATFKGTTYLHAFMDVEEFTVDGKPVKGLTPLRDGAEIELPGSKLHLRTKGAGGKIPNMLDVELCLTEIDEDRNCGASFPLPPAGTVFGIGRGEKNLLRIHSRSVSRDHVAIKVNSSNIAVEDCYSRNGTFVNEERIQKRNMRPGDLLRIGEKSYLLSFIPSQKEKEQP